MAVLKDGVLGGVRGKLGNTVYYMLNGKQISRKIGRQTKAPTEKQLANRQGMKVVIDFLKPIGLFVQMGFGLEAQRGGMLSQHAAISYNKSYALKGEYPEIEIDFAKALVSKGDMAQLKNPAVSLNGSVEDGYALWFAWDAGMDDLEWPRCNDMVMLLAYFPEVALMDDEGEEIGILDAKACMKMDGARRNDGQDVMELPASLVGRSMEVYIAVVAEDRKKISNSQYLGRLTA